MRPDKIKEVSKACKLQECSTEDRRAVPLKLRIQLLQHIIVLVYPLAARITVVLLVCKRLPMVVVVVAELRHRPLQ